MCPSFMLFYVFFAVQTPTKCDFLDDQLGATPNHIPKSGIWFTSPACRFELMHLVFAVIFAKTFLELTKKLLYVSEGYGGSLLLQKVTNKRKSTYKILVISGDYYSCFNSTNDGIKLLQITEKNAKLQQKAYKNVKYHTFYIRTHVICK